MDLEVDAWLDEQQRQHNLASFRCVAEKRPNRPRYKFTPEQLATAIRSLEKAEQQWQSSTSKT